MTVDGNRTVHVTRHFDASAERVFDAWLNPQIAGKWLFATPQGEMTRVEIDARVGGKFLFIERRNGEDVEHTGEYLELDRPRRLVFTFGVQKFSAQFTLVSIDLVPSGRGCDLTLTHEHVLPEWAERTHEGWGAILSALAKSLRSPVAQHGVEVEPGTLRFERLLPGPIERVWAYLTESDKRGQWLAAGEMEPRVGGDVNLTFQHDQLSKHSAPPPERFKEMKCHLSHHKILRFDPPTSLAFTWSDGADGPSEVSFELTPKAGKVQLVLTHRRLAGGKPMVETATGCHAHLDVLELRLAGLEPDAFWTIFDRVDGEYENRITAK
jgi:uncharacterized protein YndB with AHSA1/START domain